MNDRCDFLHVIARLDGYGGARMLRAVAVDQVRRGLKSCVAALQAEPWVADELAAAGVEVLRLPCRWSVDPIAAARLAWLRRTKRPARVHAWDARSAMTLALGGTLSPQRQPWSASLQTPREADRFLRRSPAFLRRRFSHVAFADERTAAAYGKRLPSAAQAAIVAPGVESLDPTSADRRAELRGELGLPDDAPLIATAGPLVREKQLDEAIWCFELIRVLHEGTRLLILGDGPDRGRLERFTRQVSVPGSVRFLGFRRDVARVLAGIDAYWQLDPAEATAYGLLEAMAAGRPVVVGDSPANRSAVRHDVDGFIVPAGDRAAATRATDALLGDPAWAQRLGAAAQKAATERGSLAKSLEAFARLPSIGAS
jgi:glycosyltransferase involved in cell wall biosynthesis